MSRLREYKLFWSENRLSFHDTGSLVPSGRALCRELASRVAADGHSGRRILEAGPGTGVVTRQLLPLLREGDRLTIVELNPKFVALLREKFAPGGEWQQYADAVEVLEMPVQELNGDGRFDYVVSSLPLSNFACELIETIFATFHRVAAQGAELSFFEYAGLRRVKALVVDRAERLRLAGVDRVFADEFARSEFGRQLVLANFPPACVHHLSLGIQGKS